ncbi:MAG: ATP-dependent protease ATPase subunit HslU [Nitrospirota bacterium]|nr:ATP-dependent protease ATPase subunit HslU [Nitrospirota bacterium]
MSEPTQKQAGLDNLTPRQIVAELDRYVIGQQDAKRMVAIALRNRWRRQQLAPDLRDEVIPKNIIMIGPTGVGKTEIARRLAKLAQAPFIKVEASKFTEVGYVGRDVESIIRDLTEQAVSLVKGAHQEQVQQKAEQHAEDRLLDLLLPPPGAKSTFGTQDDQGAAGVPASDSYEATRSKLRLQLRDGKLDHRSVELEVKERGVPLGVISNVGGMEELESGLREMLGGLLPGKKKKRLLKVPEALKQLAQEEAQKLIDMDDVVREGIRRSQEHGIIFIDELDKIAGRPGPVAGPDVSREGVQRDILPIIEGSTVTTKHGPVRTDHVLFIAAGAFHVSKPADLIPELQGRLPIRVELAPLTEADFVRILVEPHNALTKQYAALLATEGVKVEFPEDGIRELAHIAQEVNGETEDIGARRLHTVLEKVTEELSFAAPEAPAHVVIDAAYVRDRLKSILDTRDLSRYVL